MKKFIGLLLVLSLGFSLFALDLSSVTEVKDVIDGYAQGLVDAIPTEVSADNLWADAYIGQLFSLPPHLAVGVNVGSSFIKDTGLLSNLADLTGYDAISKLPGAPVPALSFNARVGGLLLNFDAGVHGFFADVESKNNPANGTIQVRSYGADVRFSLIKQMVVIPSISLGIGYDKVDIYADMSVKNSPVTFNFATKGELLSATGQMSWKILFIKLFAGARGIMPLNDGITAEASVSAAGTTLPIQYLNNDLSIQAFGGLALRFLIIDTTFGVTYDVKKNNVGGSVSLRVQL